MARPALALELRSIVHKATRSGHPEKKTWEETIEGKTIKKISVEAIPVSAGSEQLDRSYLVIFAEEILGKRDGSKLSLSKDKRVKQLEDELLTLREDMRSMVEAQEAANEELQSVNEEIVSSNEELQSINEELETSKEELESSNEELITINQELQMRNELLAESYEYSEAVFSTIRESLLILDKNLKVKNANSCFYKTFGVTEEETEGKLLYDIGNKQWNIPLLKELLEDIIPRNSQIVDYEITHTFPKIGEKTMLLNAHRLVRKLHSEQLILLAFEDITQFRQSEKIIKEREEWFRHTADTAPMMIWVTGMDKKLQFVNRSWLEFRNISLTEAQTLNFVDDKIHPEDKIKLARIYDDSFEKQKSFITQYRIEKDGNYHTVFCKGKPNYSTENVFLGFIGSCVEVPSDNGISILE
jgi:two-component system, chemotaxis family, CheB/CheR fusion protein